MRIITISREFGSGGREVGKRLADELGFAYYDREIITEIAKNVNMDENYIDHILEKGIFSSIPLTFGHTLTFVPTTPNIFSQQQKVIVELASRGDCVIVGRNADVLLRERNPFRVFVYADMASKVERCKGRSTDSEKMSDREFEKMIKQIDKGRASGHDMIADASWGDKKGYELCVNTTGTEIKKLIKPIAEYALNWFENR